MRQRLIAVAGAAAVAFAATAFAQDQQAPFPRPVFQADGSVHVGAFDLPASPLSSPEAQAFQKLRAKMPGGAPPLDMSIEQSRQWLTEKLAPQVNAMLQDYPVDVAESSISGIPVRVITPKGRKPDPRHVLINLHGGGFTECWESCSLLESVPIASLGGYKVISVNYRMAPEAHHPAAVEDATTVYRALLRRYPAKHIGVFGCSAGGALTAELAAWLPAHHLPQPGGVGIFGAGGVRFEAGDSAWIAAAIDGSFPAPAKPGSNQPEITRGYFAGVPQDDPIISPATHPEVMAKYPPTLIITGGRAMDMSPAIVTNSALLDAGVSSTLIVGEGMSHCYIYFSRLPEARAGHRAIVAFFRHNLG